MSLSAVVLLCRSHWCGLAVARAQNLVFRLRSRLADEPGVTSFMRCIVRALSMLALVAAMVAMGFATCAVLEVTCPGIFCLSVCPLPGHLTRDDQETIVLLNCSRKLFNSTSSGSLYSDSLDPVLFHSLHTAVRRNFSRKLPWLHCLLSHFTMLPFTRECIFSGLH